MLGRTLQLVLNMHDIIIADLPNCDITDADKFYQFIVEAKPEVVIHCAAMTEVDRCETEVDLAYKINAIGSANVASACFKQGVRLIAISTDYVFSGTLDRPYHEFDVAGNATTVYGSSKFAGEELIRCYCPDYVICRISWLYGAGGPSFVHTMMNLADGRRDSLKVVNDQIGNPTSALAVANHLKEIIACRELVGTFHLTCEGEATWFGFAKEIFKLAGKTQQVIPCSTEEFPRPAVRPLNSRLEKRMLKLCGLPPMPAWQESLAEFIETEF